MTTSLKDIATTYFESWKRHDFKTLHSLFSDDITFIGVLGEATGAGECTEGLRGLASIMTDIVIQHMWIDESNIMTWYELHTTKTDKPLIVANWSHVENGKITKIRVTFDPRPLIIL